MDALRHRQPCFLEQCRSGAGESELEVELVDVVLGKHMRRAEQNLAAVDNLELAQLAGLKLSGAGL
jgi:hypothetical protein